MRSDPGCRKDRVNRIPVVRPQMYRAVVYAQQVALGNKVLANLG